MSNFFSSNMAASLVGLKHSGDVDCKDRKATPSIPVKCLGTHCCYSMARLQMAGHALLLLHSQTSNGWTCIAVTPQPDFKWPGMHCCYSMARIQMTRHALLLCSCQARWSPSKYSIHFCRDKWNITKIYLTFVKALMSLTHNSDSNYVITSL